MQSKNFVGPAPHRAGDEPEPGLPEENPLPDLEVDWDDEAIRSLIDLMPFFQLWYASLALEVRLLFARYFLLQLTHLRIFHHFAILPSQVSGKDFNDFINTFFANGSHPNSFL